ncbi:MAG TPA: metallophosphoesterase family protein [Pirellulales bacterium]|nr:metallophosphoesterase family protein [Pirellulales bacterium]
MRTLAIGDIHGCKSALDVILEEVDPQPDDLVVLLGDYVDRGPDSSGVLDRVLALRQRCRCVALKGNHDLMMLAAREDEEHFREWLQCGGRQALASYGAGEDRAAFADAIPTRHWRFLKEDCASYHVAGAYFFVHANVCPDLPLTDQPDYMLYWERLEPTVWRPHESGKTMICGHSAQRSGRPLVLDHAVCIDTRVYGDGWLTCLDVRSEKYWQANERGEKRTGHLRMSDD